MLTATQWNGCYDEGWKGLIVDEAFAHPAKMSYALAARIYDHAFKASWIKPGDTVVDPFGGIGGTAIHAACHGLKWIGCELEPKFHAMCEQNFALWRDKWGMLPEWVQPTIHCGDSRRLAKVLGLAECVVSSPPFADQQQGGGLAKSMTYKDGSKIGQNCGYQNQAMAVGNLAGMKDNDFAAVVSSPPYAESVNAQSHGIDWTKVDPKSTGNRKRGEDCKHGQTLRDQLAYGQTPGQLGAMVVGSPPFEAGAEGGFRKGKFKDQEKYIEIHAAGGADGKGHGCSVEAARRQMERDEQKTYGDTEGNIGNQSGDTFWTAARDIVQQCHNILSPGGHAIWVCKDFVRKGKRVPFSDQWLALCESIGFQPICRHQAMLVKTGSTQRLLDGGTHTTTRERKSFFRRLAEKKGSPRIDWEDVICVRKQGTHL